MHQFLMRSGRWLAFIALSLTAPVAFSQQWVEGVHYFRVEQPQPTGLAPGKVQVIEVFSYACPGCNRFYPMVDRLVKSLPSNVVMEYLPAGFRPDEDWPMFQRAYLTAAQFGVAQRVHDAMFDAVWKTGELAVWDQKLQRAKHPAPLITDAAKFYEHAARIKPETFLATAGSFGIDVKIKQTEERIAKYGVAETPSIVVNGKYRLNPISAGGDEQTVDLVNWLVAKELAASR
jgi:protein dithiol oxidoreductase (disulfide-forming)